jgi:hypothetical protein
MRKRGIIILIFIFSFLLIAGCIQLPGTHFFSDTPDPIIGQWIGGEQPASDRHIIFYENQTWYSSDFFINQGEVSDKGTWTKKEPGLYSTISISGKTTDWLYDSFDDSVYMSGLPQMEYHRFKG